MFLMRLIWAVVRVPFAKRAALVAENLALRQQLIVLRSYLRYYHASRMHLSLGKDAPEARDVQSPELGKIVELPGVGGLHHRYARRAA